MITQLWQKRLFHVFHPLPGGERAGVRVILPAVAPLTLSLSPKGRGDLPKLSDYIKTAVFLADYFANLTFNDKILSLAEKYFSPSNFFDFIE